MYARIARAKFRTDQGEEAIRVARETLDTARRLPGFRKVTYYYDRASGWGFAVSHWDTAAQADASVEGLRGLVDQFRPHYDESALSAQGAFDITGPLPSFEIIAEG
jgi:hypothetical protein